MIWASWQASLMRVRNLAAPSARALQNHFARKREGAGNAGCALHPRSRVQNVRRKRTRAYRYRRSNPAFPAQWLYGLCRALPGDEFLLSPSPRELEGSSAPGRVDTAFARLDTSNGCQDHTVLPYAASPVVCALCSLTDQSPPCDHDTRPTLPASTASRPNVRDDGQRPSCRTG
jgi:hypothetical protein